MLHFHLCIIVKSKSVTSQCWKACSTKAAIFFGGNAPVVLRILQFKKATSHFYVNSCSAIGWEFIDKKINITSKGCVRKISLFLCEKRWLHLCQFLSKRQQKYNSLSVCLCFSLSLPLSLSLLVFDVVTSFWHFTFPFLQQIFSPNSLGSENFTNCQKFRGTSRRHDHAIHYSW